MTGIDEISALHRNRNADDALFPAIEARATGRLKVSDLHELYWEESGAADGLPVVFLHGGPGGGTSPRHRRFFDPARYRIVLHDQRGAGKSTPFGEMTDNMTQHLVADIERLRVALGIDRWVVFGGSWGSTLALAYAQAHPDRCLGVILRGIFLGAEREIDWFMHGVRELSPVAWREFAALIPSEEQSNLLSAYYRRLSDPDPAVNGPAAVAWSLFEARSATLYTESGIEDEMTSPGKALALARTEAHYFVNRLFLEPDQLLNGVASIRHLPATIVQGRYDLLCPIAAAQALHDAWPEAHYDLVPDAGHSAFEPSIASALVKATERMADLLAVSSQGKG
jgi:proline iminopeptidase